MKRLCALLLGLGLLTGCADMDIQNPFSSSTDVNQVYYDEFPDVPIPADMSPDRSRSWVSVTPEGVKIGLLTVEGRYDLASLATATIHNMNGQGWSLRAMGNGPRILQVYEKDNRLAVVYFYAQTTSVAMEMWLSLRLPDGVISSSSTPVMPSGGYAPVDSGYGGSSSAPLSQ